MALMRDVFPIDCDSRGLATREAARDAVQALHDAGLLAAGDHIMFTSGDHMEHRGATNTLRLLEVGKGGSAEGLESCRPKAGSLRSRPHPALRATFSRFAGEGLVLGFGGRGIS